MAFASKAGPVSKPSSSREKLKQLERRYRDEPKNSELGISTGEAWLRVGDVEEAVSVYARSAELDPRLELKTLYYQWLGEVRETQGDPEAALAAYHQWLALEPHALEPLDRVATLLVGLERWTDLMLLRPHYARRAEVGQPRARESLALFSFVLSQLGTPDEVSPLERTYAALELGAQSISMRYLLGVLLYRQGHLEAAQREFLRVLELDPDGTWLEDRFTLHWKSNSAHLMMARVARLQGQHAEALSHLQAGGAHSLAGEGLDEMALLLLENGRYQELLELLPEEADGWVERCRAEGLLGLGNLAAALETYERMAAPTDEDPSAEQPAVSRVPETIQELEELVAEQPRHFEAWDRLSGLYENEGRLEPSRLARIQAEKLRPITVPGGFVFATPGGPLAGFRFQATSRPGKGTLSVSGLCNREAEELARFALTLIQPRCEAYLLEDPRFREIHLHVSPMAGPMRAAPAVPRGPAPPEDPPRLDEEAGPAVLAALAASLAPPHTEDQRLLLLGRLELDGSLRGPVSLAPALGSLTDTGYRWSRLVLPRSAAPELLRLPPQMWLRAPLALADSVEDLLELFRGGGA